MKTSSALSLCIILAIGIVTVIGDFSGNTMLWAAVQNACHAPAFGVFAIALLVLLRNILPRYNHAQLVYYLLSFGISILVGITTEIIQHFLQRDAEFIDVVRDSLGAASFLGSYFTLDSKITCWTKISSGAVRHVLLVLSLLIFLSAFISLGFSATAYVMRSQEFPQICNFVSCWSDQFIKLQDATLTRVSPPVGWSDLSQSQVACLCLGESEYPGVTIEEPYPDWSSYKTLCIDAFSNSLDTLRFGLRIDDIHHNYNENDRFTCQLILVAGLNSIRIPLEKVKRAPRGRETDMKAIQRVILFAHRSERPVIVYLNRFWLE